MAVRIRPIVRKLTPDQHRDLLLQASLRSLRSRPFRPGEVVQRQMAEFLKKSVLPDLVLKGRKQEERGATALECLAQVLGHGLAGHVVADTRNTSVARLRIQVWDDLIAAGLVRMQKGSEQSQMVTRYYPTQRLFQLRELWELGLFTDTSERGLVVVKGEPSVRKFIRDSSRRDENGRPIPEAVKSRLNWLKLMEDRMEAINRENLSHSWRAYTTDLGVDGNPVVTSFQPNVCLRIQHSQRFYRYMRLYTWGPGSGQNLSKRMRVSMEIDGQEVVELDFSCHHLRMLYHLRNRNPKGDLYRCRQIFPGVRNAEDRALLRRVVKQATNAVLNTSSKGSAVQAISGIIRRAGGRVRELIKAEGSGPRDLLGRIEAIHPQLLRWFYVDQADVLQTTDGKLMLRIMEEVTRSGRPALAIHDSLVVREQDEEFVREVMERNYCWLLFTRFRPVICASRGDGGEISAESGR